MLLHKVHRLFIFSFIFGLLAVISPRQQTAASGLAASYSGVAQINGSLQLELVLSPPVGFPGSTLTLEGRLTNHSQVTSTPVVDITLPDSFSLHTSSLPIGMTFNLQAQKLTWMPVVPAGGGIQGFTLQLRAETADIARPEQVIDILLKYDDRQETAALTSWIGLPPQINATLRLAQVAVGQPVQLQPNLSGSGPLSQVWYLGDGRRVEVSDPLVVYPATGIYQVTLEVSNPLATASSSQTLTVVPHPAAQFTVDDAAPAVGQMVTFINQSGGQPPMSYLWDFGDGTTADTPQPVHAYNAPGTYQVQLTAQNSYGKSEAFWTVAVGAPPVADMEISASAPAGQPVVGQAYGDDSVTLFRWDMGDGRIYEGPQVSHRYRQPGDYYVTMGAHNEFGATQVGRWVHIDAGLLSYYLPLVLRLESLAGDLADDALGIVLPPVELSEPFVLPPVTLPENSSPAQQLFYYINAAREFFGLAPLTHVSELSQAAQQHADDMARFAYTGHTGADGSRPAERLLFYGYRNGYAGEATAWGFEYPYEAVEFWVNSPSHRRIILNQNVTDLGVGFVVDFNSPNVWYWTAEFGNAFAGAEPPFLRLQEPVSDLLALNSTPVAYRWNWPSPLGPGQQFVVYLLAEGRAVPIGSTAQPALGSRYSLQVAAADLELPPGAYEWQVKLEDMTGAVIVESERRTIAFESDPNLVIPTPLATATPSPSPTPSPTPTATPGPAWPTATPLPPPPTIPVLVTATPLPPSTPEE